MVTPPAIPAPPAPPSITPPAPPAYVTPSGKSGESAAVDATTKAIAAPVHKVEEAPAKLFDATSKPVDAKGAPALSIAFKSTETAVPLSMKDALDKVAKQLAQHEDQRVTLVAYASSIDNQSSMSRRVSLSRALAVRAYLIDAGVNSIRLNVRAEGDNNPGSGDKDRVDVFIQSSDAPK